MKKSNLLNKLTVYGHMIENVCNVLSIYGPLESDDLASFISPNGNDIDINQELIPYMIDVEIISVQHSEHGDEAALYELSSNYNSDLSIQGNLLHLLRKMDGVNATILRLHKYLLQNDDFSQKWLNYRDIFPLYNKDIVDKQSEAVPLNENKMRSWLRIVSYIGLIQPERSNDFILVPTIDLVRELLNVLKDIFPSDEYLPLAPGIEYIEREFCQLTSNPGNLHRGFADAFTYLSNRGEISLESYGDADMISFSGKKIYSHVIVK